MSEGKTFMHLNQVTLPGVDYDASVAFYEALGLRKIVDSPPRYARFECPAGDGGAPATLSLHHEVDIAPNRYPAIYFEVDDVAVAQHRADVLTTRHDVQIEFDRHPLADRIQAHEQVCDAGAVWQLEGFAVQLDVHGWAVRT